MILKTVTDVYVMYTGDPRTIDIDIILYDELIINTKELTIPHPEAEKREFVLKPLTQIAPNVLHPVIRKPVERIYNELCRAGIVQEKIIMLTASDA